MKSPVHIVLVSYSFWPPDFGGELLLTVERLEGMAARGHRVTVLTSGKPGLPRIESRSGLTIRRSPMVHESRVGRLLRRICFLLWALWVIGTVSSDVLHFGSMPGVNKLSDVLAAWLILTTAHARHARTVFVLSLAERDDDAIDLRGFAGSLRRRWLRSIDHLVSISPALHQAARGKLRQDAVLIPNGIRDDFFLPVSAEVRHAVRAQMGWDVHDTVFCFLGTVDYRKGFDLLAEAFSRVSQTHSTWRLVVIGPHSRAESQNIDAGAVQRIITPLLGNGRVTYLGRVNDRHQIAQILGACDVFVFPSRREGMGLAPMEAMASGIPAIISRLPGITDQVSIHGETGLYIEPGDAEALERAMLVLGNDESLRTKMGAAAAERVRQGFGWQHHLDQWERIYTAQMPGK
jgi:glycosyltransferase involved in cell wall biosynthesis